MMNKYMPLIQAWWHKFGWVVILLTLALYLWQSYRRLQSTNKKSRLSLLLLIILALLLPVWSVTWATNIAKLSFLPIGIYIVVALLFIVLGARYAWRHSLLWDYVSDQLLVPTVFYNTARLLLVPTVVIAMLYHLWWPSEHYNLFIGSVVLVGKGALSGFYIGGALVYIYRASKEEYKPIK